jgi:Mor family transcriptional regulator
MLVQASMPTIDMPHHVEKMKPENTLDLIRQTVINVAACQAVPNPNTLAEAIVRRISHQLAGCNVYISSLESYDQHARNTAILQGIAAGQKTRDIARDHGVTPRHIMRIKQQRLAAGVTKK